MVQIKEPVIRKNPLQLPLAKLKFSIEEFGQKFMLPALKKDSEVIITETPAFKKMQRQLSQYSSFSDFITFPELIEYFKGESPPEMDLSFRVQGWDDLAKKLSFGTPEFMVNCGVILLGSSFVYPEQFEGNEPDYRPDPPENNENYEYPEVSLIIKLYAKNRNGHLRGAVEWSRFEGYFPKNTYVPYRERLKFEGTWEECSNHYLGLLKRIKEARKQDLKRKK